MSQYKKALLGAAVAAAAIAGSVPAQAYVITATSPFALVNLGTGTGTGYQGPPPTVGVSGTTITTVSATTGQPTGLYSGSVANVATSPFPGSNQEYYAVQPGGTVTFTFTAPRTQYSLLIGTVDSYNSLTFTATSPSGTQIITGANIMTALGGTPNGTQTTYLTISQLNPFTSLTFSDTQQAAFEFVPAAVPEPVSLAVLGAGLVGMGVLRRRSAKQA